MNYQHNVSEIMSTNIYLIEYPKCVAFYKMGVEGGWGGWMAVGGRRVSLFTT